MQGSNCKKLQFLDEKIFHSGETLKLWVKTDPLTSEIPHILTLSGLNIATRFDMFAVIRVDEDANMSLYCIFS